MKLLLQAVIPALWLAWLAFWIAAAARGVKETQRRENVVSRMSYQLPLIAGGILLGWPHVLGGALEQRFHPHTFGWFALGAVLVAAGLGFSVAARLWLGGNWSANVTLKKGHELIRNGPYALVRHPIYTGLLLALLGTAVAVGKWRALFGLVLMTGAVAHKLTIEERFMREQFGEAYARYRAEVAALIPLIY